jgi:hypothetical protein
VNGVLRLTRPGPALSGSQGELARLRAHFEHRVLDVEGDAPKTALAGWFNLRPDPRYLFTRGAAGANSLSPFSA